MLKRLINDQRVRFLMVGGFNTVFGYALFVLFELTFGKHVGYLVSLYLSYAIAIVVAFFLHRHFTYRVAGTGNIFLDFARFTSVYIVSLAINSVALPLLVEIGGLAPILAQVFVVGITTVVSYFGHKLFSFRRRAVTAEGDQPVVARNTRPSPENEIVPSSAVTNTESPRETL